MSVEPGQIWKSDRAFAIDEYEQQQYYYVAEANDLITKARHDLTARELKIMDFAISKIQPKDQYFSLVKTSMYELTKVLNLKRNGKNYSDLAKTLNTLRKKDVVIYDKERKRVTQTGWLSQASYEENGQVGILISNDLAPYLLGLKTNYTQYLLLDTVKLKSKYAILLYKLMRECDKGNDGKIAILHGSPDEFKEWLGAPKSYTYNSLKNQVIRKAIEEINLKINDMDLVLYQKKRGRTVVEIEIHNTSIHSQIDSNSELITRNWLNP